MAVTAKLYGKLFENQFGSAPIVWASDTIKVALCTSSYTPDQDTHDFFNDITNEVTGTGYTAGGATLGSKTATYTTGTNTCAFDAADTVWSSSTITAKWAVVYKSTGTASTSPLICYVDFDANIASSGGAFTITWDAAGIWSLAAA
jgi:hypothetical protein